ncbi:ParA family protein [Thaumasiovibrio subtropicus]|uniref:ParA family protein n=1 Tax=Thaumasiovibrio subtropicus TaxID=1891207 RepID=UPI00131D11CB|nr:ParA family protein [Thaumasiovibrio subtropicus]
MANRSMNITCGLKSSPATKVLILNRKGGAGKSTFAISLASVLQQQYKTELIDFDEQCTSQFWASQSGLVPGQHFGFDKGQLFSLQVKVDRSSDVILIDTPSNFSHIELERYLALADRIIIPLQPSPVDIHATLNFMSKLINSSAYRQRKSPIAFVATRNAKGAEGLAQFTQVLNHLGHPILGDMTSSPVYQQAFEDGLSFTELAPMLDEKLWERTREWLTLTARTQVQSAEKGRGYDRIGSTHTGSIGRSGVETSAASFG